MRIVKKAVCLLLVFAMLIGILPAMSFAADAPFQDVAKDAWYNEAVSYVYDNGIMAGTASNQFSPKMEVTRAQMCQILYNMEDKPENNGDAFSDVNAGNWFYSAVNWAASVGIVSGVGNGEFAPQASITREQAMTILYNYASHKGHDVTTATDLSGFIDASKISTWATVAMQWAVGSGYLSGVSQIELLPAGTTTRGQIAMILMRFSEKNNPSTKPVNAGGTPGINIPSNTPSDDDTLDEELLKKFKEKDIEDFPGYEILNFDESQETNFAVLQKGTVVTSTIGTTNQLVSRDDENGVFVIEHISDDIANLKPGDVLYFTYGNTTNDYILLKVGEISFDSDTATITADSDTEISDYYEYVDIDMDIQIPGDSEAEEVQLLSVNNKNGDYGNVENAEGQLPITLIDEDSLTVTDLVIVRVTIFYDGKRTSKNDIKVDEINLIRMKLTQKLSVEVSGKYNFLSGEEISKPVYLGYGFDVTFSVTPIFEIDTDISASFTVVYEDGFCIDYKAGKRYEYGQNSYIENENISSSKKFKCSIGAQATVSLNWTILSIASLNARGTLDLTATGKSDIVAAKRHDCYTCVSVHTDFTYSVWVDLITIDYRKGFKDTFELLGDTIPLDKYYISRLSQNSKIEFGVGECPHYSYHTLITAKAQDGKLLSGVTMTISGSSIGTIYATTDKYGQYKDYFPNGTYKIHATLPDFTDKNDSFTVSGQSTTKYITLNKKDDPEEEKPPVENPPEENPPEVTGITGSQADIMCVVSENGSSYTPCSQAYIIDENNVLWMCEHDGTNDAGGSGNREKDYKLTEVMPDVAAVSCGSNFVAAIKTDGSLWTWGANNYGQLGNGSYTDSDTPIKVLENVTSVSCGDYHTLAIKADGSLWAWGASYGEWEKDKTIPQKVAENIIAASCGSVAAAINSEHELLLWGSLSETGTSVADFSMNPQKIMDDVVFVDAGQSHIGAIKSDASLWMWGTNKQGQLGDSTKEYRSDPVKVMDGVTSVSCGMNFTAAVKTDESLWTWGMNYCGHSEGVLVPTQITTIGNVETVNCSSHNSIAVLSDGSVYDWGIAFNMQDWQISAPIISLTPEKIPGITAKVPNNS